MKDKEKFGAEVRRLRLNKGLSQEELAKLSGFSGRSSIQMIEKGKTNISLDRLEAMAKALDIAPSYFLDFVINEGNKELMIAEACKGLNDSGLDALMLFAENLKKIPGMTKED